MANIMIIGSGVVGTATGKGLATKGHQVTFVDIDVDRIEALRTDGFAARDDPELPSEPTTVFLTLPTPNDGRRWDLGPFSRGTRRLAEAMRGSAAFHTIVVRSTVPPGTCERVVQPILEKGSGRRTGEDFAIASNPEFLRAQCALEDFLNPWVTVIGSRSQRTLERLHDLLAPFGGEIRRFRDPAVAEYVKCAHNLFNATKISFWNELWRVGERLGLDSREISSVVARSAEGSFNPEYGIEPGRPYGGACLPKDTKGFLGFAEELGVDVPLLRAVDEVNELLASEVPGRPEVVIELDGDRPDGERRSAVSVRRS